ncbi:hypothetical protein EDB89DRAFT_874925 [Lactarius sanguifluus]|nr:hypothetical protein EDB89DRAFT_874925 [Lactarius sanguifluus]
MENQPTIPSADPQPHHIPSHASRPNMPTHQQDQNPTIQNCCSCVECLPVWRTQARPLTRHPMEQQDARHFDNTTAPHLNRDQGIDNRAETATIVPDYGLAQFVSPQTARTQYNDNFGYAPVHERAGLPNMGLPRALTLDASIAESRRLLAGRYLNNPDAHVSTIRLEPGPSGQFQVIITLEMANVLA